MTLLSLQPTLLATLALFLMNTLPSLTKSLHFLNPATITFVNFSVAAHTSTSKQRVTIATSIVHSKLDHCNSLYHNLPNYQLNRLQQIQNSLARSLVLLLRLINTHISLLLSNLSGLRSTNALNINFFLLPTKF